MGAQGAGYETQDAKVYDAWRDGTGRGDGRKATPEGRVVEQEGRNDCPPPFCY